MEIGELNRITVIVLKTVGIVLTLSFLVAAYVWGYLMRPSAEVCRSITYELNDGKLRQYVFRNELEDLLRAEDIEPVGRTMRTPCDAIRWFVPPSAMLLRGRMCV